MSLNPIWYWCWWSSTFCGVFPYIFIYNSKLTPGISASFLFFTALHWYTRLHSSLSHSILKINLGKTDDFFLKFFFTRLCHKNGKRDQNCHFYMLFWPSEITGSSTSTTHKIHWQFFFSALKESFNSPFLNFKIGATWNHTSDINIYI